MVAVRMQILVDDIQNEFCLIYCAMSSKEIVAVFTCRNLRCIVGLRKTSGRGRLRFTRRRNPTRKRINVKKLDDSRKIPFEIYKLYRVSRLCHIWAI